MSAGRFHRSGVVRAIAVALLAVLVPACGGSKSKPAPPPGAVSPSVVLTTPAGVQKGVVSIDYTLFDTSSLTCTIAVAYSTNGGTTWSPATAAAAGDGTTDLGSSAAGVAHVFSWNTVADRVALGSADPDVRLRITPTDTAAGTSGATSNFTVDNIGNTPPSVTIPTPAGTSGGLVALSYTLTDGQSDPCTLEVTFSVDGGATFSPATPGPGGDGTSQLASLPGGSARSFLWNTVADGVAPAGENAAVRIRLRPSDGALGTAVTTANFKVDNSGKSSGSSLGGGYPIQVNGTGVADWATSTAADRVSLYTFGFEGFDFESTSGADSSCLLRKRSIQTGAPVAGFGTAGTISVDPGPGLDFPFKAVVSGSSLFLLIAKETGVGSRSFVLRIEKRSSATGALVGSFGTGGVVEASTPAGYDGVPLPWTLAVDGTSLYVAGSQKVSASDSQWRIEKRDRTTGQLVAGFGAAGRVDENPTATADGCFSIVIGSTSMWLVGAEGVDGTTTSDGRIRMEKRSLLDGSLEAGFGSGGVVTVDPGLGDDLAEDALSDGTSLFVFSRVETALGSGLFQGRIEKRSLGTGALATAVTGAASDPTGELPFGHLALEGGALFVCQADGSADAQWRVEKRSTTNLSLVSSFGVSGVLQSNPAVAGYDRPLGIVAAGGVVLLAGMDSVASDGQWRIEARWR